MRFLVPQFIEVEDKLFGPLSFRQFVYLVGSIGFAGALYALYGVFAAILSALQHRGPDGHAPGCGAGAPLVQCAAGGLDSGRLHEWHSARDR